MAVRHYYNEYDERNVYMLRQLMSDGLIPEGDIDGRSITEVTPDELRGYTSCHFFAGIGGWSLALRLAGWADDRPVWTGSCPCQPFSSAGKQKGKEDERHLWPTWFRLIRECRPARVYGEQVATAISHGWLDGVYADMEEERYAIGSAVLPACGVDAPHKRDRLWFVADAQSDELMRRSGQFIGAATGQEIHNGHLHREPGATCDGPMADRAGTGLEGATGQILHGGETGLAWDGRGVVAYGDRNEQGEIGRNAGEMPELQKGQREPEIGSSVSGRNGLERDGDMAHTDSIRSGQGYPITRGGDEGSGNAAQSQPLQPCGSLVDNRIVTRSQRQCGDGSAEAGRQEQGRPASASGFWHDADWIVCGDGKARRIPTVESGIRLLGYGVPARVATLYGFGNAIVPEVAARFIRATL